MNDFGLWSIVPPLVAIVLAIVTRRVIPSLFLGVLAAAVVYSWSSLKDDSGAFHTMGIVQYVPNVLVHLFESFLWPSLIDPDHLRVFAFTLMMGAMVGVIHVSGGMIAIAHLFAPLAKTRLGGQLVTYVMGLVIFFDDYANTLLVGNTMRPITDRLKISREKLAYIVDTTAAPISGLALVSTWVATEISYVDEGTKGVIEKYGPEAFTGSYEGFWIIALTIPYRFYILLALVFVPMLILLRRDFGSMQRAEQLALSGVIDSRHPVSSLESEDSQQVQGTWVNAVVPIVVMVFAVLGLIISTGWHSLLAENQEPTIWSAFPQGNSYVALVYGSLAGWAVAAAICFFQRTVSLKDIQSASLAGARSVVPALMILWMAWSLSSSTEFLQTGEFLSSLINPESKPDWMSQSLFDQYLSVVSIQTLPTLIFVIACSIAFATGTSWGTMAVMTPLVVSIVYDILVKNGGPVSMSDPHMLAAVGSVLAGAIFGDHCSPISDTTVLSSQSSSCNHILHVRTQMTYAFAVGVVSVVCGTLPVGYGWSVYLALPIGVIALFGIILLFGRKVREEDAAPELK